MSEKKKFMPAITNYLSDNEEDIDDIVDNSPSPPPVKKNYAEWKRSQKTSNNVQNGTRSFQATLGDISSCDEDSKFDDTEPLYKIMNCLADKEAFRKRVDSLRKRHKKPSTFLLFSRMKQQKHLDCSFNDLCQIIHASWENMQSVENEELTGNLDQRIAEYKEVLLHFKETLLPDSIRHAKPNSRVPLTGSSKPDPLSSSVIAPNQNHIVKTPTHIPERLQNLVGNASVYNASDKVKRISPNQNFKTNKTNLNYVSDVVCDAENCRFPNCENSPIDDFRWDGQYCSVNCLIQDCHRAFQNWLDDQRYMLLNGGDKREEKVEENREGEEENREEKENREGEEENREEEENRVEEEENMEGDEEKEEVIEEKEDKKEIEEEDEIMMFLRSPGREQEELVSGESEGSISREENIFESLQRPLKVSRGKKVAPKYRFDTDMDSGADMVAMSRLHSLISRATEPQAPEQTTRSDGFEYFHDRANQSVTEKSL